MANADRSLWERNLTRYRVATAMMEAEYSFGPSSTAGEDYHVARAAAEHRFGNYRRAIANETCKAELHAAWMAMEQASDAAFNAYALPQFNAAIALIRTPAPDLESTLKKIEVVNKDRLHTTDDEDITREEVFAIIAAELRAFGAEVGL